jgi:hypothetical protein
MTYAKIENGIVENLIEIAHNAEEFPDCVLVDDRPVQIGDAYQDGVFYRAGEMVKGPLDLLADAQAENQEAFAILRGEV